MGGSGGEILISHIYVFSNLSDSNMYNENSDEIKQGDKVIHTVFGEGVVIKVGAGLATIAFQYGVGIKTIAANHKYLNKKK